MLPAVAATQTLLLLKSGDIEMNPGPGQYHGELHYSVHFRTSTTMLCSTDFQELVYWHLQLGLRKTNPCSSNKYQERIMTKNVRGEERDTTTHLIEIVLLLTLVVLLNLARVFQKQRSRKTEL